MSATPEALDQGRRRLSVVLVFTLLVSLALTMRFPGTAHAGPYALLSGGMPTTASSTESAALGAANATDSSATTRWSSAFRDGQWLQVDLGVPQTVSDVSVTWEAAYARTFSIQASNDLSTWSDISGTVNGVVGRQNVQVVRGLYRFVRLNAITRATGYGFSVFDFSIVGPLLVSNCRTDVDGARNKPAMASSVETANTPAAAAFDGVPSTRWSSAFLDSQWLQVDLGAMTPICRVALQWERAYAKTFHLEQSNDGISWTPLSATLSGQVGPQTIVVNGEARFLRIVGETRATAYGFSLFDVNVSLGTNLPLDCPRQCPPSAAGSPALSSAAA